ncbi:UDP-N-acetylglucosamine 2-epimerase (non-hydrolyzing) [soil metagenome]
MSKPITIVFGTRPEAIKVAPIILELRKKSIAHTVIHTGQHAELADQILLKFSIEPDIRLNLMEEAQTPLNLLQKLLTELPKWIHPDKTNCLIVQGDTTTALAGALTAHHQKVKLTHLEAGLRSHDRSQPFPEEANRTLISHLADFHFAPTAGAQKNLIAENIPADSIQITGNSVVDALHYILENSAVSADDVREKYNAVGSKLLLLTTHRRENFGEPLRQVFEAITELSEQVKGLKVLLPAHPNPKVQDKLQILRGRPNIEIIEPVSYSEFVPVMAAADLILTDSGGIQEEAPALGTPVFVLRNKTERPELIESGAGKLIGTEKGKIVTEVLKFFESGSYRNPIEIFGDGKTAGRVVRILREFLEC